MLASNKSIASRQAIMTSFSLSKNKLLVVFSMQCTQDKKYYFSSSACLYLYRDPMHTVENLKLLLNKSILRKAYLIVIFRRALPFLRNSKGFLPKRHLPIICTFFNWRFHRKMEILNRKESFAKVCSVHWKATVASRSSTLGVSEHSFVKKAV